MRGALDRRALLRGALGGAAVSVALPRLAAMLDGNGEAYAQTGAPLPRRFGTWTFANGVWLANWVPAQTGTSWSLSPQLMPLGPVREYVSVVSGLNIPFPNTRTHCTGQQSLMTGALQAGTNDSNWTAARKSIDQLIAERIGKDSALKSLELAVTRGVTPEPNTAFHYWSHNGPNSPNITEPSCKRVLARLVSARPSLGGAAGSSAAVELALQTRRSVLDAVLADGQELQQGLGAADRARIELHLDGIRTIEKRIQSAATMPAAQAPGCKPHAVPADTLVATDRWSELTPVVNQTMAELLGLALACDLTRVFTFQFMEPANRQGVQMLVPGVSDFHGLSHHPPSDPGLQVVMTETMKALRVFVETLRALPEGAGNVLDNSAIMVANDVSEGATHAISDFPLLVVGRAGGLRSGVHYRSTTKENALRLPLTLARAVGAPFTDYGINQGLTTESLSAIGG